MAHISEYLTPKPNLLTRTVECLCAEQHLVAQSKVNISLPCEIYR